MRYAIWSVACQPTVCAACSDTRSCLRRRRRRRDRSQSTDSQSTDSQFCSPCASFAVGLLLDRVYRTPLLEVREALCDAALRCEPPRTDPSTAWKPIWSQARLLDFEGFCEGLRRFEQLAVNSTGSGTPTAAELGAQQQQRGPAVRQPASHRRAHKGRSHDRDPAAAGQEPADREEDESEVIVGVTVKVWQQVFDLTVCRDPIEHTPSSWTM